MVLSSHTVSASLVQPGWYFKHPVTITEANNRSYYHNRGFAVGWDYAIGWLVILPFELTAASLTIQYWRDDLNVGIWIAIFLVVLSLIQLFGVRGYGEGKTSHGYPGYH
jgi:amino acid permease